MEEIDVIIGNVKNEIHNVAKIQFIKELEKAGFKVLDLGVSVPNDKFVEKVKATNARVLVLTAIFFSATESMKQISRILKEEGLRNKVKILIGGPNMNEDWLRRSEADEFVNDISEGVKILHSWKDR